MESSTTTTMKNKKIMPTFYNNRFKTVFFNRYPFPKRRPIDTDSSAKAISTTSTSTMTTTTTTTTTTPMTTTSTTTSTTPMTTSTAVIMTVKTTKSVQRPKPKLPYLLRPFFIKLKNTPITPPTPSPPPSSSPTLIQKQPQEMLELFDARTKIYVTRPPPDQKRTIMERPQKFGFKLVSTTIRTPVTTSAAKVAIMVL